MDSEIVPYSASAVPSETGDEGGLDATDDPPSVDKSPVIGVIGAELMMNWYDCVSDGEKEIFLSLVELRAGTVFDEAETA